MSDESADEVIEVYALTDAEHARLALFPLPNVVLLPGTALGLHLFEPRYRQLARDVLAKGGSRALAICGFEPGWESDVSGRPPIKRVAGAGRIVSHRENPDGTFDIVVVGVGRVSIDELPEDGRLYRSAVATPIEEEIDDDETPKARAHLLTLLRGLGVEIPEALVDPEDEAPVLADRVAEAIVSDAEDKQKLLEMADVAARLRFIADVAAQRALGSRGARGQSRTLN